MSKLINPLKIVYHSNQSRRLVENVVSYLQASN